MPGSIRQQHGFAHLTDLPCWQLQFGAASAVISSYGAQLLSYQPSPGDELLWLSPKANWQQQAIRGGIPLCWPWFGPADPAVIPDATSQPAHGFARTRHWQLKQQQCTETFASLTLHCLFTDLPHCATPTELRLNVCLNQDTLQITLSCDQALPQQAALHSYFRLNQLEQLSVRGLGTHYLDKVSQQTRKDGCEPARLEGETDRIYLQAGTKLLLQDAGQRVYLQQSGHDSSVLWNPAAAKSRALKDVADDGYQQFVCVETTRLDWQAAPLQLRQTLSRSPASRG
ncbi:D-hexose-6-phosphate mutarotase [Alkalimonas amylolytica]|uniref:Putative glucose-6-phosphate 1-epimerase n=1 Tax=Alkalimonas amylolytica TaxID=152573 RepID=A0A1H4FYR9_ALKAM|nr:D-hexose-6-phosphate mutarotase [Alkalimonas amylolytica]SEB02434.1 glucose-6-phosphate 1-epimerase [Alkalimonas amylolytica]